MKPDMKMDMTNEKEKKKCNIKKKKMVLTLPL